MIGTWTRGLLAIIGVCCLTASAAAPEGPQKSKREAAAERLQKRRVADKAPGASIAADRPIVPPGIEVALRTGQYRNALPKIRKHLDDNPDDADLHALLGYVYARIGMYGDAQTAFGLSLGSTVYEMICVSRHADTLRYTGDPEQAAQLRRERVLTLRDDNDALPLLMGVVEDLRYAGDFEGAEEALYEAMAMSPGSGVVYAMAADLAMDQGDMEEASYNLWLAALYGQEEQRVKVANARLLMLEGDYEEAQEHLNTRRIVRRYFTPIMMQAEIYRRQGIPDEALAIAESARVSDKTRPEVMAEQLAALASLGDLVEAREVAAQIRATYPRDPNALAALAVLEKAEARAQAR